MRESEREEDGNIQNKKERDKIATWRGREVQRKRATHGERWGRNIGVREKKSEMGPQTLGRENDRQRERDGTETWRER